LESSNIGGVRLNQGVQNTPIERHWPRRVVVQNVENSFPQRVTPDGPLALVRCRH
jgi:hypothetical protein